MSYYIVGGREEGGDSLQTGRRTFLPAKVGIDTGLSSACSPSNFLALPVRYEAPAVITARRILPLDERDINVEEVYLHYHTTLSNVTNSLARTSDIKVRQAGRHTKVGFDPVARGERGGRGACLFLSLDAPEDTADSHGRCRLKKWLY